MTRKIKKLNEDILEQNKAIEEQNRKAEELRAKLKKAQEEEAAMLEKAEADIQAIADEQGLFCGIILSREDIVNIIKLVLDTGENIKIPFKLYFTEI